MANNIYFGFARRKINPTMAISLAGYFNVRMWESILDDIEVRVLVLRQEKQYTAIVQFDLSTANQYLINAFHAEITDIVELHRDNMIITATHTHTAPETTPGKKGSNAEYLPFAAKQAANALREAIGRLQPGTLVYGKTFDDRFAFNRRYWMKDGSVVTNPGKQNPQIDRPEGKTDSEIPILGILKDSQLQVLIANIVNHTDTIGGNNVSADWPGFTIRQLQSKMGNGSIVFPLIGCSGNINHFDVSTGRCQTCYAEAERIGRGYASTIDQGLGRLKPLSNCTLAVKSCRVVCGSREITDAEIAEAKSIMEKYKNIPNTDAKTALTSEDLARKSPEVLKSFAQALIDRSADKADRIFILVSIYLGDACIVSLPREPFVEIGLEIKQHIFGGKLTMVVSHSNGTGDIHVGGYIPNRWNYGRGGYETSPRANPFSIGTAELLLAGVRSLK